MEEGSRVGAIRDANSEIVNLFGYGVYSGEEIPPDNIMSPFGLYKELKERLKEKTPTNPKIVLDSGEIVWGCECWWGPEEKIKAAIGDRKVNIVQPRR